MEDRDKTKTQLAEELNRLRKRETELEKSESERKQAEEKLSKKTLLLESLSELSPDIIYLYNIQLKKYIYINQELVQVLGYSSEEIKKQGASIIISNIHPEDLPLVMKHVELLATTETDSIYSIEYRIKNTEGNYIWFLVREKVTQRDKDNKPEVLFGIVQIITERKQLEKKLVLQGEIITNMSEGVYLVRADDDIIVFTNPKFEKMFGYGPGEMIGKKVSIVNAPTEKSPKETARNISETIIQKGIWKGEIKNIRKDGTHFWSYASVSPFDHSDYGRVLVAIHTDITDRKKTEKELNNIFNLSPDMVAVFTTDGKLLKVNPSWQKVLGYTEKELLNMGWSNLVHPDDVEQTNKTVETQLKGSPVANFVNRYKCKDGSYRTLEWQATFAKKGIIYASARDITERKNLENKLKDSEIKYHDLFENSSEFMFTLDLKGTFTDMNKAAEILTGYSKSELLKMNFKDYTPKKDHEKLFRTLSNIYKTGESFQNLPVEAIMKDGAMKYFETSFTLLKKGEQIIGFQGSSRDFTERKKAADALHENRRMLSIRNKIAEIFLTVSDENMFGDVLQVMRDATGSKYGVFGYIDEDGATVSPSMTRDVWEECNVPDKSIRFPRETWGNSIWARAIIEKRSFYKNESGKVPEGHVPIDNVLVVPILFQDKTIGHFELANRTGGYSDTERILIEEICSYIAPVLSARLERDRNETNRKHAEDNLRISEEKYRSLVESTDDLVYLVDKNCSYIFMNKKYAERFNLPLEKIIGRPYSEFHSKKISDFFGKDINEVTKKVHSITREHKSERDNIYYLRTFSPAMNAKGEVFAVNVVSKDISELKQVENKLKKSEKEIHNFAEYLQTATEKERALVASELHDEIGQALTGLKMDIFALKNKMSKDKEEIPTDFQKMENLLNDSIQKLRKIYSELRPTLLEHFGVGEAMKQLVSDFQEQSGTQCTFYQDPEEIILDEKRSLALYRILQGAINNIKWHAQATKVNIRLEEKGPNLNLSIKDNGKGITDEQIKGGKSFGLIGMRERARYLRGILEIKGLPDKGTTVKIEIPLKQKN